MMPKQVAKKHSKSAIAAFTMAIGLWIYGGALYWLVNYTNFSKLISKTNFTLQ